MPRDLIDSVPIEIESTPFSGSSVNHAVSGAVERLSTTPMATSNQESCVSAELPNSTRKASTKLQELRKSSAKTEPQDPVALALRLAQQFPDLQSARIRDRLGMFLQDNYFLGFFFKQCPEQYQRFKDLPYWRDVRQKPSDRNVMRSILTFTMDSKKQDALQNRACKYARVLEHFCEEEVVPDEVAHRLKDGGGVDATYSALCRRSQSPELPSDTNEGPISAPAPEQRSNGAPTNDERPYLSADPLRSPSGGVEIDREIYLHREDGLRLAEAPGTAKQGPLNRIDLNTILAVEMGYRVEEVLEAKLVTIRAIVGPRDDRGWARVVAVGVLTSNSPEGPWPDDPTAKRDGDEQR